MSIVDTIEAGQRLLDTRSGKERTVKAVERLGRVIKVWFEDPKTGNLEPFICTAAEAEERFQILTGDAASAFRAECEVVRYVAEAHRLGHAYLFNSAFATETSLIDLLPHQFIAVYDHMLKLPRLRFLLADDAGAGKTIMAGLYIREMLLRRLVSRVLIVPPAGLVGNWERELRNLFRLRFRIISSQDGARENPFENSLNDLAIVSIDTVDRTRMRAHVLEARPYDLVIFDEVHKLSCSRDRHGLPDPSLRYELAEAIAAQGRNLLLLTATPHMGKDEPYYFLWRLLDPELLPTQETFNRLPKDKRARYYVRRMKEEMVTFDERPIYPPRESNTVEYPLTLEEKELYDQATTYCQFHYNKAKQRNRGSAGLAMSVLQRRLASSTWALLRSLERREAKLTEELRQMEQGLLTAQQMEDRQGKLPTKDVRDEKTGDEEEIGEDGIEEAERNDEEVESATDAVSPEELREEINEVHRLVGLARSVYELKHESKFERLWEALQEHPDTKVLLFTEHRDTMAFLVGRLEGLGLTGRLTCIHGGMGYQERDQAVEQFRDPDGARYLVATDAAGEGINLQFCWLLVNYDIPWNPARIEQRMGRVHRYKQRHEVKLINLVSKDTREGRVLKVLLKKLEAIRKELGTDKVFDVIGQQFAEVSLPELMFRAVVEGQEAETVTTIDNLVTTAKMKARISEQRKLVECSEVRNLLVSLRERQEQAELRRVMPSYVRRYFEKAAGMVGIEIVGSLDGIFSLRSQPDNVRRALLSYPEDLYDKLTFNRELAMPQDKLTPEAIYLHPGEVVFEAVTTLFLGKMEDMAAQGAVFRDASAGEPYLFFLAKVPVLKDRPGRPGEPVEREIVDEAMIGVRRFAAQCEEAPAHLLLELDDEGPGKVEDLAPEWAQRLADLATVEAFVYEKVGTPALEKARQEGEARLDERKKQLQASFGLYEAELLDRRRTLKDAVAKAEPAAKTKLNACEEELAGLDARRAAAEAALFTEVDSLRLGPITIFARALVLPGIDDEAKRRRNDEIAATAMKVAAQHEKGLNAVVEDVSDPQLAMGFDLRSTRPDGEVRYIEVKGRARVGEVELTENEWDQAKNHPDRYWLYVVFNCDTTPTLRRIKDPAGRGIGKPKGGVTIDAVDILVWEGEEGRP